MKTFATLCLCILSALSLAATKNISGTWRVTNNHSMRLIFTPQGSFKFAGANYSSSGTYKVDGDSIYLTWTKVDGAAVKPGAMKRTLSLTPDDTFTIDQYTYSR